MIHRRSAGGGEGGGGLVFGFFFCFFLLCFLFFFFFSCEFLFSFFVWGVFFLGFFFFGIGCLEMVVCCGVIFLSCVLFLGGVRRAADATMHYATSMDRNHGIFCLFAKAMLVALRRITVCSVEAAVLFRYRRGRSWRDLRAFSKAGKSYYQRFTGGPRAGFRGAFIKLLARGSRQRITG